MKGLASQSTVQYFLIVTCLTCWLIERDVQTALITSRSTILVQLTEFAVRYLLKPYVTIVEYCYSVYGL